VTGPKGAGIFLAETGVASLTSLPKGKYLVSFSMTLQNQTSQLAVVQCFVDGSTLSNTPLREFLEPNSSTTQNDVIDTMSFTVPLELASDNSSVTLNCTSTQQVSAQSIYMTALQVENLIKQ
jgi:hypothetical protein